MSTKREQDFQSIKKVLNNLVTEYNLTRGMHQISVIDAWKNIMGSGVNSYTQKIELKKSTLNVHLSSSILREELTLGKNKIITLLNEELGEAVISKINFY